MDKEKTCTQCDQTKPATLTHFNADNRTFDKLTSACNVCIADRKPMAGHYLKKLYFRKWYSANRKAIRLMSERIIKFDETG